MSRQVLNTGINPNDGEGDSLRDGGAKINFNFQEIYSTFGDGSALLAGDINFGSIKLLSSNSVVSESSLSSIDGVQNRGTILHVQEENALYYVNGTTWIKLLSDASTPVVNYNDSLSSVAYSGTYNDLTDTPTIPTDVNQLTDQGNKYALSADIPTSITDLNIDDGADGQVLATNADGTFSFITIPGGSNAIGLTDLSVSVGIPNGAGNLNYDNTTGVFNFTPANLSLYTPSSELADVATTGDYEDLANLPNLLVYAVSTDISAVGFSGEYSDLINPPSIPANTSDLVNDDNFIDLGSLSVTNATASGNGSLSYAPATGIFTFTPPDISNLVALTDLSVINSETPADDGAIAYDNTTGQFTFTPPDLSGFATTSSLATVATSGVFGDLTNTPTTIAGYGITDAFSGDFASLTNKPTTIAGYGITDALEIGTTATTALAGNTAIPSTLTDLGIADGTAGQILSTDGAGNFTFINQSGGASIGNLTVTGSVITTTDAQVQIDSDLDVTGTVTVGTLEATNFTVTGAGTSTIESGQDIVLNASGAVRVVDTPFRLAVRTTAQRTAIPVPTVSDMIFNSDKNSIEVRDNENTWMPLPRFVGEIRGSAGAGADYYGSGNISFTRNSVGNYSINLPLTFPAATDYIVSCTVIGGEFYFNISRGTSTIGIETFDIGTGNNADCDLAIIVYDMR